MQQTYNWRGELLEPAERATLERATPLAEKVAWWLDLLECYPIVRQEFVLPESHRGQGLEQQLYWLSGLSIWDECCSLYPGIAAAKDGYLPIGGCFGGSGNPYYIHVEEGPDPALYQIFHEGIEDRRDGRGEVLSDDAVGKVAPSLSWFMRHAQPGPAMD